MSTDAIETRKWCVSKAIEWCKPGEDTTDDMLVAAQKMEHFITDGAKLPLVDQTSLAAAFEDATLFTPHVTEQKAKAVCTHIAKWLKLEVVVDL